LYNIEYSVKPFNNNTRTLRKRSKILNNYSLNHPLMSDEIRQIQAQQDELNRKLNEKISDDLNKFQKAMDDIFKQKQVSQQKYFIQKIKEEQEQADSAIKSGDLMSAMAHKLTADWYSSMIARL
jgi:DNA-directed RNA polymerase subunit L